MPLSRIQTTLISGETSDSVVRNLLVPSSPTNLTVSGGNAQAVLSWTSPTGVLSQAPITDYVVQVSLNSGSSWSTFSDGTSTATSATVTGLTNGTAYVFRVAAVNAVGVGAYTAASSAVTPASPLFRAIPILTSATSSGEASASAILSGGLDAWRAFDKASVTSDGTFYASPSPASGSWLQYDFGSGVSSSIGGYSITPRYLASYGDSGTGVSQAPDSWTLSGSNDGTNFTTIDTRNSPQSFSWGQARTFTLSSAVSYRVYRWTWTSTPAGSAVIVPKIQLLSPLPDAPTSLTATAGNAQASLTWTAPAYNGGSAITDYSVQFSADSGSNWTTFSRTASTTASQVVTGLTNGTAYVFRVAGINANGTGTYTSASSSATPSVPTSIAGLQLWLDASDASTLFNATTGGSLVAADGAVARWEDKSGNGRHFTQSTAGSRPARKTNQQNGRDALLFDGSNDHLIGGDYLDLNGTNQITTFLAIKTRTSSVNSIELINKRDDTGGDSGWYFYTNSNGKLETGLVNSESYFVVESNSAVAALNNGAVLTFKTVAGSATSATAQYRNGSLIASTVTFNQTQAAANVSKQIYLGILEFTTGTFARPFDGNFCEVIIYNAALSDANRSVVESYLMSKWGIS